MPIIGMAFSRLRGKEQYKHRQFANSKKCISNLHFVVLWSGPQISRLLKDERTQAHTHEDANTKIAAGYASSTHPMHSWQPEAAAAAQ